MSLDKHLDKKSIQPKVEKAIIDALGKKIPLKASDSFVAKLGFNSLRMVSLSLALEEAFDVPLVLNEWISQTEDPTKLTVASLCDYIFDVLTKDGSNA